MTCFPFFNFVLKSQIGGAGGDDRLHSKVQVQGSKGGRWWSPKDTSNHCGRAH